MSLKSQQRADMIGLLFWFLVASVIGGLVAGAVLLLFARPAHAAPLPPPRPLTEELLVGRWDFQWGQMLDGWIQFRGDGIYHSRHSPGFEPQYAGHWRLEGDTITLHEGPVYCEQALRITGTYPIRSVTTDGFPVLIGRYAGREVRLRRK